MTEIPLIAPQTKNFFKLSSVKQMRNLIFSLKKLMVKVKPFELRKKDPVALDKQLMELRTELNQLRVV